MTAGVGASKDGRNRPIGMRVTFIAATFVWLVEASAMAESTAEAE